MSADVTNDYDNVSVIGRGSFGVVSRIRRKSDGKVKKSLSLPGLLNYT
jgi:hypothetical protein